MKYSLTLFFKTDKNDTFLMKIPSIKYPLNEAAVNAAMDAIIATGAISSPIGTPVAKKKVTLTKTTTTVLMETV